ncbi:type II toxin-antitoxin system VapC family toxin [bacterium]|nr:type II toxin-antitoxin system VapC family toxin [bacterium]MCI0604939.1 type II toxin-antitoxin system VapC family toxin [bacterium]
MTFLVDVNVLSEPTKPAPVAKVVDWLMANEGDFVVNSIILGEIYLGVLRVPGGRKRAQLDRWFDAVVRTIDCLPWDAAVGLRWAELLVDLKRKGHALPLLDSMIAATALEHHLTVVTRNTRDFQKTGAKVFDPFA